MFFTPCFILAKIAIISSKDLIAMSVDFFTNFLPNTAKSSICFANSLTTSAVVFVPPVSRMPITRSIITPMM
jgi:hypothetical protein